MASSPSARDGAVHSLVFRVMRLCRPALQVDLPVRIHPHDLIPEGDPLPSTSSLPSDGSFAGRSELHSSMDAFGVTGMLVLPQTFGSIYLGETFCSYISVSNSSGHEVTQVGVKAELQTERQRVTLADNTHSPIGTLPPGGRYDFIIEHDIKELGAHTLICSAAYVDAEGERKYLPQYFKFLASNPLSVRTKVRTVKESTFLEACIENSTKGPLFLDQVRFDPSPNFSCTPLNPDETSTSGDDLLSFHKETNLIKGGGCSKYFLYHLTRVESNAPRALSASASANVLGKLDITWRGTLGEPGRLQTQQIMGNAPARKEVEMRALEVPPRIEVEKPFLLPCRMKNSSDKTVGPIRVGFLMDTGVQRTIVTCGPKAYTLPELPPHSSHDFSLSFVALGTGLQRLSGIGAMETKESRIVDTLPPLDFHVDVRS